MSYQASNDPSESSHPLYVGLPLFGSSDSLSRFGCQDTLSRSHEGGWGEGDGGEPVEGSGVDTVFERAQEREIEYRKLLRE